MVAQYLQPSSGLKTLLKWWRKLVLWN